tara:strand:- start:125 stop:619 length:495 start_codon:yes stop_codon:yes gene_type:complete
MNDKKVVYSFSCKTTGEKELSLSNLSGKVLLIVNTASKCGFTPQYKGLENLHKRYKDSGFEVLAFPCNQFGSQEPGSDQEIEEFCSLNYQTSFMIFSKVEVNGEKADPLFQFLTSSKPGLLGTEKIKWNFTKFLIDRSGRPVKRFAPNTKPEDLVSFIEKELEA